MGYLLPIIGMVSAFFMLKYRERIGDMLGEADWMRNVGGVYRIVVLAALFLFFWSLAELTGTTRLLFTPLLWFFPGGRQAVESGGGL